MSVSRLSRQSIQAGFPKQQSVWDGITQPAAMDALSSVVLTASQNNINFNNIPQTYTHLQIRAVGTNASGESAARVIFNSDTGTNYSVHFMYGNGSTVNASALTGQSNTYAGDFTTSIGSFVLDILDYTNTNKYKSIKSLGGYDNNGSGSMYLVSGLWLSTAAITSITLQGGNGNFTQYSTFSLYGIK
jgi:hypothetical protein